MDFSPTRRAREQQQIAPRKGLTKYALESRLVPFTEGVLNAIIGLRIFISKHQRVKKECRAALLSSQIINGSVLQNKSAGTENNKNAKIG